MSRWLLIALVGLLGWVPPAPSVSLRVQPRIAFVPVVWIVSVRVPPHPENRYLVIGYRMDGEDGWTTVSSMTLDGENERESPLGPRGREIRQTRPGSYTMLAQVKNGLGAVTAQDKARLRVLKWGG
ncbi:hypothetical protein LCGC14_0712980 [marine sediment metagenome]|uniref:Uncharacterized protein n=1 Tax=marine sediment metagenome TaxID=412755 RepID=A0A0F9TM49_9ZZZZ